MDTTTGFRPNKFFRLTLLNGDPERIQTLLGGMKKEIASIEKEIASLVYYMNGGLSYELAYNLTFDQMRVMTETINTHHENQAKALSGKGKM